MMATMSSSSSSLPSTSASVTPASLPDSSLAEWEGWIAQAASGGEDELYDELDDEIAYQFKVRIHTMVALVRVPPRGVFRGVSVGAYAMTIRARRSSLISYAPL